MVPLACFLNEGARARLLIDLSVALGVTPGMHSRAMTLIIITYELFSFRFGSVRFTEFRFPLMDDCRICGTDSLCLL